MTQSSYHESLAVKLRHIADIIEPTKEECVRCGKKLDHIFMVYSLLLKDENELIGMKGQRVSCVAIATQSCQETKRRGVIVSKIDTIPFC